MALSTILANASAVHLKSNTAKASVSCSCKDNPFSEALTVYCSLIIKRVIAVGGDHLDIKNNEVYINGKKIKENYIKENMNTEDLSIDIPKGKVFVMGDNRNHSLDSRKLGYFDFDNDVIGKVFFKIPL